MCLLEWDLFLQWWKGVEWRIPRSKDWPLIKAGIYDHHRNGAESFSSPLKRKKKSLNLNWPSVVLVSGTETIVKFWYRSRNFFCQNFFLVFLFKLILNFPLSFQIPKELGVSLLWKVWIWTQIYKNNLEISNIWQEIWFKRQLYNGKKYHPKQGPICS